MGENVNLLTTLGITGYTLETAIKVGPMFVRPKELQTHLGRYALRFVNIVDHEVYQLQHLGTATGISYRGRKFVISTNHQRKLGDTGNLGIVCISGNRIITPSRMWTLDLPPETEREDNIDFTVFEYETQRYPDKHLSSQFFPISDKSGIGEFVGPIALNIGYPTRLQNVDYYEGEVDLLVVSSYVKLIKKTDSQDVFLFEAVAEDRFFEDGMSGSPIFEVVRDNICFQVKWLGIVIRGGDKSRKGQVINASFILRQIDKIIA